MTFYTDSISDLGYLNGITFLNDSGLVVKRISFNRKQDTIEVSTYKYNEHNFEVYSESVYKGKTIVWTTSYRKLPKSGFESLLTREGKTTIKRYKEKATKHKLKCWHYKDGKLVMREVGHKKRVSGRNVFYGDSKCRHYKNGKLVGYETTKNNMRVSRFETFHGEKTIAKSYLDSNQNVVSINSISYGKSKKQVGGYAEIDPDSGITTKDKGKYKEFKYARESRTYHEYNEIGLVKRTQYHPPITNSVVEGFTPSAHNYTCYTYQYLTE